MAARVQLTQRMFLPVSSGAKGASSSEDMLLVSRSFSDMILPQIVMGFDGPKLKAVKECSGHFIMTDQFGFCNDSNFLYGVKNAQGTLSIMILNTRTTFDVNVRT